MSGATYGNESQDFSYLHDSQMNSSEYAAESNIYPEGSSSSLRDMALPNNTPLQAGMECRENRGVSRINLSSIWSGVFESRGTAGN